MNTSVLDWELKPAYSHVMNEVAHSWMTIMVKVVDPTTPRRNERALGNGKGPFASP